MKFSSSSSETMPEQFSHLKKSLWKEELRQSWTEVLAELDATVEEISRKGGSVIPRFTYAELKAGLTPEQINVIKKVGVVVITGGIPPEEALNWKDSIRDYASANAEQITGRGSMMFQKECLVPFTDMPGYPPHNIQIYEMYNSKGQVAARTHPAIIDTQRHLLSLWHSSDPNTQISLANPVSYFDRVRIRQPGDESFVLDPHIDNGSVERWEDPTYRQCYRNILKGGSAWKDHDAFDVTPRLDAAQDMHNCSNQGSIFRAWQGWTSMSRTAPGEGTLRVLPMLGLAVAYMILRPFFRLNTETKEYEADLENPDFPGSLIGGKQFFTTETHPHLGLDRTMIGIPTIEPGDQVYWHCDTIHEVESHHRGTSDSSVIYIPAVPLTVKSAQYLRDQRATFEVGLPGPDFPKGPGESSCKGRAIPSDVQSIDGRRAFGLESFEVKAGDNAAFIKTINQLLF